MIAQEMINSYIDEMIDEVLVIYNEFKSVISQRVVINRILPVW